MPETETLYLKVRREVKDRLERLAKERGAYLAEGWRFFGVLPHENTS